jgi:flagellar biosynthesis anti-sigma factor FlgM
MVGIQGVGGIPEPKPDRPASARDSKESANASASASKDGVAISTEAQAAATLAQTIQVAASQPDIRADRVAEAKEAIERGDFKNSEVVAQVADKIGKFL